MSLHIAVPRDSASEQQVHITGDRLGEIAFPEPALVVEVTKMAFPAVALRLTDVLYSVQSGLCLFLWWEEGEGKASLILPLEGRGRLDLAPLQGILNPRNEGFTGHVLLTTEHAPRGEGLKSFFLGLEFAKVHAR